jgi:hypothetical protein
MTIRDHAIALVSVLIAAGSVTLALILWRLFGQLIH